MDTLRGCLEVSEAPTRPPLSWTKLTLLVISGHLVITLVLPHPGDVMGSVVSCDPDHVLSSNVLGDDLTIHSYKKCPFSIRVVCPSVFVSMS